jgi:NADP-dependent 3-hydroxy acid dehydrogenase YdfG
MNVELTGRRVLVTGASSGIGEATCRAVVDRGASVAMLARRKERLDALAEELGRQARRFPSTSRTSTRSKRRLARGRATLGGLDAGLRDRAPDVVVTGQVIVADGGVTVVG